MGLVQQIAEDLKASMKARDELRLSVVRMLKSAVKNREIEKMAELTDEDVQAAVSSMLKQRRDSVEQYTKAGRPELAAKEEAEAVILQGYLPEQLSEDEVVAIIRDAIAETSAKSASDMGRLMKAIMPKVKGKADGKFVNLKVKELLGA